MFRRRQPTRRWPVVKGKGGKTDLFNNSVHHSSESSETTVSEDNRDDEGEYSSKLINDAMKYERLGGSNSYEDQRGMPSSEVDNSGSVGTSKSAPAQEHERQLPFAGSLFEPVSNENSSKGKDHNTWRGQRFNRGGRESISDVQKEQLSEPSLWRQQEEENRVGVYGANSGDSEGKSPIATSSRSLPSNASPSSIPSDEEEPLPHNTPLQLPSTNETKRKPTPIIPPPPSTKTHATSIKQFRQEQQKRKQEREQRAATLAKKAELKRRQLEHERLVKIRKSAELISEAFGTDADLYGDVLRVCPTAEQRDIRAAYFRRGREVLTEGIGEEEDDKEKEEEEHLSSSSFARVRSDRSRSQSPSLNSMTSMDYSCSSGGTMSTGASVSSGASSSGVPQVGASKAPSSKESSEGECDTDGNDKGECTDGLGPVSEKAKRRFQAVSVAYEILSDPKLRDTYEAHGLKGMINARKPEFNKDTGAGATANIDEDFQKEGNNPTPSNRGWERERERSNTQPSSIPQKKKGPVSSSAKSLIRNPLRPQGDEEGEEGTGREKVEGVRIDVQPDSNNSGRDKTPNSVRWNEEVEELVIVDNHPLDDTGMGNDESRSGNEDEVPFTFDLSDDSSVESNSVLESSFRRASTEGSSGHKHLVDRSGFETMGQDSEKLKREDTFESTGNSTGRVSSEDLRSPNKSRKQVAQKIETAGSDGSIDNEIDELMKKKKNQHAEETAGAKPTKYSMKEEGETTHNPKNSANLSETDTSSAAESSYYESGSSSHRSDKSRSKPKKKKKKKRKKKPKQGRRPTTPEQKRQQRQQDPSVSPVQSLNSSSSTIKIKRKKGSELLYFVPNTPNSKSRRPTKHNGNSPTTQDLAESCMIDGQRLVGDNIVAVTDYAEGAYLQCTEDDAAPWKGSFGGATKDDNDDRSHNSRRRRGRSGSSASSSRKDTSPAKKTLPLLPTSFCSGLEKRDDESVDTNTQRNRTSSPQTQASPPNGEQQSENTFVIYLTAYVFAAMEEMTTACEQVGVCLTDFTNPESDNFFLMKEEEIGSVVTILEKELKRSPFEYYENSRRR